VGKEELRRNKMNSKKEITAYKAGTWLSDGTLLCGFSDDNGWILTIGIKKVKTDDMRTALTKELVGYLRGRKAGPSIKDWDKFASKNRKRYFRAIREWIQRALPYVK